MLIFSEVFSTFQGLAWFFPPILIFSGIWQYYLPKIKGWIGERRVKKVIDRHGFEALHDAYLQDDKGRLTQIDHAVFIGGHLVIIETKNYSGAIFGKAGEGRWTQKFGQLGFKLQNPIIQNRLHTRIASDLFPKASIHSLVCFVGDAKFPKGCPEGIVYLRELADALKDLKACYLEPDSVRAGLRAFVAIQQAQYVVDRKAIELEHLQQLRDKFGNKNGQLIKAAVPIGLGVLVALLLLYIF